MLFEIMYHVASLKSPVDVILSWNSHWRSSRYWSIIIIEETTHFLFQEMLVWNILFPKYTNTVHIKTQWQFCGLEYKSNDMYDVWDIRKRYSKYVKSETLLHDLYIISAFFRINKYLNTGNCDKNVLYLYYFK